MRVCTRSWRCGPRAVVLVAILAAVGPAGSAGAEPTDAGAAPAAAAKPPTPGAAGPAAPILKVGISEFAPFVLGDKPPRGYSVEVWKRIAGDRGLRYQFVRCAGAADKLRRLREGELDVAIGGLTVSTDREVYIDFTHPTYRSGLGIMVRGQAQARSVWGTIFYALKTTPVIWNFIILMVVAAHLIWFAERGKDAFSDRYFPGVVEGLYWAVVTASTVGYGDKAPVKWAGRFLAMLVIVVALPLFALFTAQLTTAFTVDQMQHRQVGSLEDLHGGTVGVVQGTTSATLMARMGLRLAQWPSAARAYAALEAGQVDAVVYDAPALRYYANTTGKGKVVVGSQDFDPSNLAMAVREGSPLREIINRGLLQLGEGGVLDRLQVEWMGNI